MKHATPTKRGDTGPWMSERIGLSFKTQRFLHDMVIVVSYFSTANEYSPLIFTDEILQDWLLY